MRQFDHLDGFTVFDITHIARTKLRFFFVEKIEQLATDTDAERGLKEQQYETDQTSDHVDGATHVIENNHIHHQRRQSQADPPSEALLRCPDVFGSLIVDHPASDDQRWRIAWIHEDPDKKVDEKSHDGQLS